MRTVPLVLGCVMVFAAFQMHAAACGLHVSAVERAVESAARAQRPTMWTLDKWSYRYCRVMQKASIGP